MKKSGDILYLNKRIAKESLDLEMQIMNYSSKIKCMVPKIHNSLISDLTVYNSGYRFINYQSDSSNKSHFETANSKNCNCYYYKDYLDLIDKHEVIKILKEMDCNETRAIEFISGENPAKYSAKIYPCGIKIDAEVFADHIFSELNETIPNFNELGNKKTCLINRINKLNNKLSRMAKEPVGFWETVFGAFGDMFR